MCFVVGDVVVEPVVDFVDFPVDTFEQLVVVGVVTVVFAPDTFQQDCEDTTGCEDCEQDGEGVGVHEATACTSTMTCAAEYDHRLMWPSTTGTHEVLQMSFTL